jgi:hypothetical protein
MTSTREGITSYYESRTDAITSDLKETKKSIRNTSVLRISTFLITILGIYIGSAYGWLIILPVSIIGFGLFIYFVIRHARLFKRKQWFETLLQINTSELDLLAGNTAHKDSGIRFLAEGHEFAEDLDIFGKRSLFQLIDRSATHEGRESLAHLLNHPIHDEELLIQRQEAIGELREKPDWRQQFQASGLLSNEKENEVEELKKWALDNPFSFNTAFYRIMLFINPLIGFGVILMIILNVLSFGSFVLFLFLPFALIGPKLTLIGREHNRLGKKGSILNRFSDLLNQIQDEHFTTALLRQNQKELSGEGISAGKAVKELSEISAAFDYRLNLLVGLFLNVFFLWDIIQMNRLEKWKKTNGKMLDNWFQKLAVVDELCSFSGFAFNHPESIFPALSAQDFELQAENVRHPLLNRSTCVGNEVHFSGWKDFQVITGANMAGKSTYLRTVGVNLVLAMTGAPVLADTFLFKPVNLFTSIQTSDSLQDGESYFFAELKRLKQMIHLLEEDKKLFIILDEILRGTNSADKRKGSKSLISQLVRLGASGMIATHDLTLGALHEVFPEHITNKRFEVEIIDDELFFDYKLKEGVSQNLNATFLMKKMGITID